MKRTTLSRAAATATLGVLVSTGLAVGAGTAGASPSNCSSHVSSFTGTAICHSGTGSVRVRVHCRDNFSGATSTQYGPWVGIGRTSSRDCYPAQRSQALSAAPETRNAPP